MIRVGIADDHSLVRVGLCSIIQAQNDMELVGEAETGRQAIDLCRSSSPDVLIMDYSMPDMDGLEATKQIVASCENVRILVITMHDNEEYAIRFIQAGASGFVAKGSSSRELPEAIRKVAAGGRYVTPSISEKIAFSKFQPDKKDKVSSLSDRELQVVTLLARGFKPREIADELGLSYSTVENYKHRAMGKLDLRNDSDITRFAIRAGLIKEV